MCVAWIVITFYVGFALGLLYAAWRSWQIENKLKAEIQRLRKRLEP